MSLHDFDVDFFRPRDLDELDFFDETFGLQLPFVPGFLPGVGSYPGQQRPAWPLLRSA